MAGLLGYCETQDEVDRHLEHERNAYEDARDAEEWHQMRKRIAELEAALTDLLHIALVSVPPEDLPQVEKEIEAAKAALTKSEQR